MSLDVKDAAGATKTLRTFVLGGEHIECDYLLGPQNPVLEVKTQAAIAAGATSSIDSSSADSKKLAGVWVWFPLPFVAELYVVNNGVETLKAAGGGLAYTTWPFIPPHPDFVALGTSAGTDVFRVKLTNQGNEAADAKVTFAYQDGTP